MIVSHKYQYIFLKTNKTAGTSIEIALSKYCGPDDIITSLPEEDEAVRRSLGYPGAQNHFAPLADYGFRDYRRLLYGKRKHRYYNHMPATEIREFVGQDVWNRYYKFCVERNPWDRVISYFYWQIKMDPACGLDAFLASDVPNKLKRRGIDLYSIDNQVAVDRVCLYENLAEDLAQIGQQLGLPGPLELPRTKQNRRKDKRHYREILTDAQKTRIAPDIQPGNRTVWLPILREPLPNASVLNNSCLI